MKLTRAWLYGEFLFQLTIYEYKSVRQASLSGVFELKWTPVELPSMYPFQSYSFYRPISMWATPFCNKTTLAWCSQMPNVDYNLDYISLWLSLTIYSYVSGYELQFLLDCIVTCPRTRPQLGYSVCTPPFLTSFVKNCW